MEATYHVLKCIKAAGNPLPSWCTEATFKEIEEAFTYFLNSMFTNKLTRRLSGGALLKEIMKRMAEVTCGEFPDQNKRNLYFFVAVSLEKILFTLILIDCSIYSFIHPFIRSFIYSFINSYINRLFTFIIPTNQLGQLQIFIITENIRFPTH